MPRDKIGIIGLGYVGLPLSIAAAKKFGEVVGYDRNAKLIQDLKSGFSHIKDVSNEQLEEARLRHKMLLTDNLEDLTKVELCIICVPTPVYEDGKPNLSFLTDAVNDLATVLSDQCVIINESTSFPGTLREVIQQNFESNRANRKKPIGYVAAPERIDPGNGKYAHHNTPRVIGGTNKESVDIAHEFYRSLGAEVKVVSSPEVAEFSKLLENTFRLVNISFVNELVSYSKKIGVDINEVIDAASTKPFGYLEFRPGPGIGGHCIPVDPYYLLHSAFKHDEKLTLVKSSFEINSSISKNICKWVNDLFTQEPNKSILIVGVAYKQNVLDTRESPAIDIAKKLESDSHKIYWQDALVTEWNYGRKYQSEKIDLVIALGSSTLEEIQQLSKQVKVLDCTGRYSSMANVVSYFRNYPNEFS